MDSVTAPTAPDRHPAVCATRATAFGLDVWSTVPLPCLAGTRAPPVGRMVALSMREGGSEVLGWPPEAAVISEQRELDGGVHCRIEADPEAGYLFWGPTYGAHLLESGGRRLVCALNACSDTAWQRLLIAQVLPFCAVLHGLEAFHASAVAIDGRAVAFVGPSGAGKTSLAVELCRLGAGFLADDVLVLERHLDEVIGHPGSPLAGLAHEQAERLHTSMALGDTLAINDRERLVRMPGAVAPMPLAAVFFLDRRPDGPSRPRFASSVDARMLLAATFNFVLGSPRRLSGLLDICALVAQGRVERITVDSRIEVSCLADAVRQRLSGAS